MTDDDLINWAAAREKAFSREAKKEGILRDLVLKEVHGGLWHTTHPDRFDRILRTGHILAEPDIPDSDRWKTSAGRKHYPYVRILTGVSLFDFAEFESEQYAKDYPMSTWMSFVPYRSNWKTAVWIEIDRQHVAGSFISGAHLLARWKADEAHGHCIMPMLEAACLQAIPCSAFKQAFSISEGSRAITPTKF